MKKEKKGDVGMNVLMISPGYPTEINYFTRGIAVQGARVFGIGDQPEHDLPQLVRQHLAGYLQVSSLLDEVAVMKQVAGWKAAQPIAQGLLRAKNRNHGLPPGSE